MLSGVQSIQKMESNEPDYSRPPTLKVKIPYWEGEFKGVEVYDQEKNILFPSEESNDVDIQALISKASNVATLIYCGGICMANGKFGVTWKLFQAIVKPRISLSGKCQIELSPDDKDKLEKQVDDEDNGHNSSETKEAETTVNDTDDEEETKTETETVEDVKPVVVEDIPKKQKVVKKKAASSE